MSGNGEQQQQKIIRARGRAKGRARPQQTTTRPGEQPQVVQPAAAAAAVASTSAGAVGGGRQTHRGVPRQEPSARPGEEQQRRQPTAAAVAGVAEQMQTLTLQQQPGERSGRGFGSRLEELVTRPPENLLKTKVGTGGMPIRLLTNYFNLEQRPAWCVHHYHVDFSPQIESSRMRRALLGDHREALGTCYLFDGMSDLKSVTKLEHPVTEFWSTRRTDDEKIRITVKHTQELAPNDPQLGHLFNTQMRRNLQHLKYLLIGRHYFDKNAITEKTTLKLQIWQGIVTSIRMQEERLMMMVDSVHKIVRQDTAWGAMSEIARKARGGDHKEEVAKELIGAIVMTQYNNRTYRIEEVCWGENPENTFDARDGTKVSYVSYYKKQYDIIIKDLRQPLLLCTSKEREVRGGQCQSKRIMLIPELCLLTGLDEKMRSNFSLMKELANETKLDPQARVQNLLTFIQRINSNPDVAREMNAWDLKFSNELVKLNSRRLNPEVIVQRGSEFRADERTADFGKEMRGRGMHVSKHLTKWVLICTRRDSELCRDFLTTLVRVCSPMGMTVSEPIVLKIDDDRVGTYTRAFQETVTRDTELVLFIVPNNKKDRYDALKKLTCIDCPVPSQVVVARTLSKKQMLMSVSTKIGIQLNCKLGGEPWAVKIPFKMNAMIIGYDTYHDSSRKGRSAGAFVASLNTQCTRWYSRVNFHSAGGWEEISSHLKTNLTAAIKKYREVNGALPKMIILYRDGVGDGQIRYVMDWEVAVMEKTIQELLDHGIQNPNELTRFAFFVVNKRISTRFFACPPNSNRCSNPPPGTIVDHTVTRYERYDFFLVSQSVHQGTVAPTMYNIIKDHSGLAPNHMQMLSFKLTHLYYNWQGTIRVPAPCQYAHKLAFLAGQSLHREPSELLSDTLFYL